jgi:hypothetical protein|tara:strand:- start:2661 stop:3038 length:378 start_codon:yes stop_codon:yes gene_type:complete
VQDIYWENGERVPAYDPRDEEIVSHSVDSPVLIMMRQLISFLKNSPHPDLSIECICMISSICYDGRSMAEMGREHKVSRATISRRCVDLCEAFGIEPIRAMRSRQGRENCRNARLEKLLELLDEN